MPRYAINLTSRKLHKQGCRYNREAFENSENINLEQLLAGYQKTLQCCKVCLKHDTQAQETVKWHNEHCQLFRIDT